MSERGRLVRLRERQREKQAFALKMSSLMASVATPRFAGVDGRAVRAPTRGKSYEKIHHCCSDNNYRLYFNFCTKRSADAVSAADDQ